MKCIIMLHFKAILRLSKYRKLNRKITMKIKFILLLCLSAIISSQIVTANSAVANFQIENDSSDHIYVVNTTTPGTIPNYQTPNPDNDAWINQEGGGLEAPSGDIPMEVTSPDSFQNSAPLDVNPTYGTQNINSTGNISLQIKDSNNNLLAECTFPVAYVYGTGPLLVTTSGQDAIGCMGPNDEAFYIQDDRKGDNPDTLYLHDGYFTTDNELDIHNASIGQNPSLESIGFTIESYSILPWQQWGGVSASSKTLYIEGSRGSLTDQTVVNWVQANVSASYTIANTLVAQLLNQIKMPPQLNFAIKGTLLLNFAGTNYSCPNIIIAQGSYDEGGNTNNIWWLFSNMNNTINSRTLSTLIACNSGATSVTVLMSQNSVEGPPPFVQDNYKFNAMICNNCEVGN